MRARERWTSKGRRRKQKKTKKTKNHKNAKKHVDKKSIREKEDKSRKKIH